jgi:hypothetical protein
VAYPAGAPLPTGRPPAPTGTSPRWKLAGRSRVRDAPRLVLIVEGTHVPAHVRGERGRWVELRSERDYLARFGHLEWLAGAVRGRTIEPSPPWHSCDSQGVSSQATEFRHRTIVERISIPKPRLHSLCGGSVQTSSRSRRRAAPVRGWFLPPSTARESFRSLIE